MRSGLWKVPILTHRISKEIYFPARPRLEPQLFPEFRKCHGDRAGGVLKMCGRACDRRYLRRCESDCGQTIAAQGRATDVQFKAGKQR